MRPFREGDTFATFRAIIENVTSEINALDNEYILKASQTEIEQHYIEKVLIKPLILHTDQLYIENQSGTRIDVSHDFNRFVLPGKRAIAQATRVDVAIPYEGSDFLWRVQASTFSESGHRNIDIRDNEIVVCFTFPDD